MTVTPKPKPLEMRTHPEPTSGQPTLMPGETKTMPVHRVLLAEDDQEMRTLLAYALRAEGYDVIECRDGFHLLDHLASHLLPHASQRYDLVISDIRMPLISGIEVLEGMRRRKEFPPMILITAFGDEKTHADARRLGAAAILDKPFPVETLLERVSEILGTDVESEVTFPLEVLVLHPIPRSEMLEEFVRKRAALLAPFASRISDCRVSIEAPFHHRKNDHRFRIHVTVELANGETGSVLTVSKFHDDLHVGIRDAIVAILDRLNETSHPRP